MRACAARHCTGLLLLAVAAGVAQEAPRREAVRVAEPPAETLELARKQGERDRTTWAKEVEAQEYEAVIIAFWDRLRKAPLADRFGIFAELPVSRVSLGPMAVGKREFNLGIRATNLMPKVAGRRFLSLAEWRRWVEGVRRQGYQVLQSEWHHSGFAPRSTDGGEEIPAKSEVDFELHLARGGATPVAMIAKGVLEISWDSERDAKGRPVMETVSLGPCALVERAGSPLLKKAMRVAPEEAAPGAGVLLPPLIVRDLNGDVYPEVIVGGVNSVFWNRGGFEFERRPLFTDPARLMLNTGLVADVTGDGRLDFVGVESGGKAWLLEGVEGGGFAAKARRPWQEVARGPSVLTAGDIDRDGDLDLWFAQYKVPYKGGQMPTPFHDANDGYPSFLFVNDGTGNFTDGTIAAGLAVRRHRRTYSASFVDLDADHDLDLLVVADFAGLDAWLNDGSGKFLPAPAGMFGERHGFGMAHAFGHFDGDGREDLYMVGMSSTTARRLDRLGLKREDFPEYATMRAPMAFGNRLYQARDGKYVQSELNRNCARAGWAWGAAGFDLENDGDDDLYVANGHISGESATDYCTNFWRHDLYTGSSKEDPVIEHLLTDRFRPAALRGLEAGRISWNGYEHNRLFLNHEGKEFLDVGFLFGVSYERDCRSVAAADLDADGRKDLLVVDHQWTREKGASAGVQALLMHRNVVPSGHWLAVRLVGQAGISPIGAKVTVHGAFGTRERRIVTGDSFYTQHPAVAHFGLGEHERVEKVTVRWPDGRETELPGGAVDRYLVARPPGN